MPEPGRLLVCATPIGNLGDISDRLRQALGEADLVLAEDTRRTAVLLHAVGVGPPVISLFVGNEAARRRVVLEALAEGKTVALVSDAGTPGVSDPGADTVRAAREAGYPVTVVPGPSAVTAALAVSGVPADRFVFEGFLPRKGTERGERIASAAADRRPVVFFVSPHRLLADLADLAGATGPERRVVVTRELTKLHEEVWVGTIGAAVAEWTERPPRGEVTLILLPGAEEAVSLDQAVAEARGLVESGASPSEAARRVAAATGLRRGEIYRGLTEGQERS